MCSPAPITIKNHNLTPTHPFAAGYMYRGGAPEGCATPKDKIVGDVPVSISPSTAAWLEQLEQLRGEEEQLRGEEAAAASDGTFGKTKRVKDPKDGNSDKNGNWEDMVAQVFTMGFNPTTTTTTSAASISPASTSPVIHFPLPPAPGTTVPNAILAPEELNAIVPHRPASVSSTSVSPKSAKTKAKSANSKPSKSFAASHNADSDSELFELDLETASPRTARKVALKLASPLIVSADLPALSEGSSSPRSPYSPVSPVSPDWPASPNSFCAPGSPLGSAGAPSLPVSDSRRRRVVACYGVVRRGSADEGKADDEGAEDVDAADATGDESNISNSSNANVFTGSNSNSIDRNTSGGSNGSTGTSADRNSSNASNTSNTSDTSASASISNARKVSHTISPATEAQLYAAAARLHVNMVRAAPSVFMRFSPVASISAATSASAPTSPSAQSSLAKRRTARQRARVRDFSFDSVRSENIPRSDVVYDLRYLRYLADDKVPACSFLRTARLQAKKEQQAMKKKASKNKKAAATAKEAEVLVMVEQLRMSGLL